MLLSQYFNSSENQLEHGTSIHLDGKEITDFEKNTFQNLTQLLFLYLKNNSISCIDPIMFFGLNNLFYLDLYY